MEPGQEETTSTGSLESFERSVTVSGIAEDPLLTDSSAGGPTSTSGASDILHDGGSLGDSAVASAASTGSPELTKELNGQKKTIQELTVKIKELQATVRDSTTPF